MLINPIRGTIRFRLHLRIVQVLNAYMSYAVICAALHPSRLLAGIKLLRGWMAWFVKGEDRTIDTSPHAYLASNKLPEIIKKRKIVLFSKWQYATTSRVILSSFKPMYDPWS